MFPKICKGGQFDVVELMMTYQFIVSICMLSIGLEVLILRRKIVKYMHRY